MSPPPRRVLPLAMATCACPVQHLLHARTQAGRHFWLACPDRLEHLDDEPCIDILYRDIADNRDGVGLDGIGPLRSMLGVAPIWALSCNVVLRGLREGNGSGPCEVQLRSPGLASHREDRCPSAAVRVQQPVGSRPRYSKSRAI